jgi:MFS family permease
LAGVKLLADVTPLRASAAYRRFWAGTTLSTVGGSLTYFAVTLQVYDLTRSPAAVGLIGLATMVPLLTIGLLGGTLIDRVDRRKLVLCCTSFAMAVSAALAALAFLGLRAVWPLYLLFAMSSAAGAVNAPARRTLIRGMLPAGQLPAALALDQLTFQITLTAGPALAGAIVAAPHLGLRGCYLIDTASFAAALYGAARLPRSPAPPAAASGTTLAAVAAGVSFIRRSPVLCGAFLADLNATFFGLPTSLFPAINAARFGGDPRTLGLLTTAIGVGGLVSAVFSGPVKHLSRQGLGMLVSVSIWGAAFAVFALAGSLWLTLLALAVAGAADAGTVVLRGIIVQTFTPEEFRGRVTAADYVVGAGGAQLGSLEAGAVGSLTSPVISALSGGLLTVVGAVVIGAFLPAFRRYRTGATAPVTTRASSPGQSVSGPASGAEHLADVEP